MLEKLKRLIDRVEVPDVRTAVEGFELIEPIGSGGFSRVHRATQIGFGRDVALKVLTVDVETPAQQAAFERECRAMGALAHHPSIVSVFTSAFTDDGRPCIVMEYFAGGTLGDRVKAEGPLDLTAVLRAGVEVCGALQTAHDHGIVHRDIKPSNLFVSEFGNTALGDFGISSFDDERTVTGGGGLTVHYAPPELIEGEPASASSDIYSLAASLHTLAAGDKPFPKGPGQTTADLARRILIEPAPVLTHDDIPAAFAGLLVEAMAKRPSDRPATAGEFGRRLQQIQADLGLAVTPLVASGLAADDQADRGGVVVGERSPVVPQRLLANRRLTAAALGGLALVAVGSTAMAVRSGGADAAVDLDDRPVVTTPSVVPGDDDFFGAPPTPTGITVAADGDQLSVAWTPDLTGLSIGYQVQPTGADVELIEVEEPKALVSRPEESAGCVVVRAVGDGGRLSADSDPVCPGD